MIVSAGKDIPETRISRSDMLLMLLYAEGPSGIFNEPVGGKTRLQKEIFLSQKKLREAGIKTNYPFRPYKYGPYSIELYDDIELMEYEGIIRVEKINLGEKGIFCNFKITEKGVREIKEKISDQKMDFILGMISSIKKEYNKMNIVDLVEFTHIKHPEYVGKQE